MFDINDYTERRLPSDIYEKRSHTSLTRIRAFTLEIVDLKKVENGIRDYH